MHVDTPYYRGSAAWEDISALQDGRSLLGPEVISDPALALPFSPLHTLLPREGVEGEGKGEGGEGVSWEGLAKEFLAVLEAAVFRRVSVAPPPSTGGEQGEGEGGECAVVQGRARVGVLFSGGVDSVVLAALVDRCVCVCVCVCVCISVCAIFAFSSVHMCDLLILCDVCVLCVCAGGRCLCAGEEVDLINVAFENRGVALDKR